MFRLRTPLVKGARFFNTSRVLKDAPKNRNSILKNRFFQGIVIGLGIGVTYGLVTNFNRPRNNKVGLESVPEVLDGVNLDPPTNVDAFPKTISVNKVPFLALGTGVRTVTFLNFHVYAAGIYIAADDVKRAKKVFLELAPQFSNPDGSPIDWTSLLNDEIKGRAIINRLLEENVQFAIRITPTRNTDFNHLRDGFVRSIMNQKEAKSVQSPEFGQSIAEIKRAFGRKRKLTKGEVITWSRDVNGGMTAWYGLFDDGKELLGSVNHPDAARLFFLQYLSGNKPSSPTLKESCMNTLAKIATSD